MMSKCERSENASSTNQQTETASATESNHTKVLIIGGGMAGLSAAYHLTQNGCTDFKLLEGRDRIGGRIAQIAMAGERIELGANWIHGILGNPVYEFAMEHDLVDILQPPTHHKVVGATQHGKQIPFGMLHEIYEAYTCFLRRCEEYFVSQYSPPAGIESVGDHIRFEIQLYLDSIADHNERRLRQLIFDCLLKREACISGCGDMREIDVLEIGSFTELQGGNIVLPNGYSSILDPLAKHIDSKRILLGYDVIAIDWSDASNGNDDSDDSEKTVCEEYSPTRKVLVTCSNGAKFKTDHVICTIPLGVLKHTANTLFQPLLPEYKIDAIDRLLFGTVEKIILEYERPFLNPNITEILLLWDDEDESAKNDHIETKWFKKIYSFTKITDTLLMGWISGKEAEYMETLPRDQIAQTCTNILRQFLNDPFIPKPKRCVCTSWHAEAFTRGSYTAIAVGASQLDIELIAQPVYTSSEKTKPTLLFAGEHTHSNFYSTVHGAYLSGRTAALMLLAPDEQQQEIAVDCVDTNDLSSWIQGIRIN